MKRTLFPLVLVAILASGGCVGRAISEGVGKVTGPKAVVVPVTPVSENKHDLALAEYTTFEVGEFKDDFGGRTPPVVFTQLPVSIKRVMTDKGLVQNGTGKTLVIRGEIIHFELAGTMDQAFGPFEELMARVHFIDKQTGKAVGTYNCVGRSRESVNKGTGKKIDGLAEAIVNAILRHYPDPKKRG